MDKRLRFSFASLLVALAVSFSAHAEDAFSEEAMMIKASELTKLSTAVESAVRYERERSAGLGGRALLKFATEHDPELLSRFSGFEVRVSTKNSHATVLICTADGRRAILEDAGCTAPMDRHAWREGAETPCEFRLNVSALCAALRVMPEPRAKVR